MDIFCKIIEGEIPSYTFYEDDNIKAFLDVNPKSPGHSLIIPKLHYTDISDINDDMLLLILKEAKIVGETLISKLGANGFTLVQNNGAPQEVKHFHLHVIPSYDKKIDLSVDEVYKILNNNN